MSQATLTIDLKAIAANWRALDALSNSSVETAAVVKADAYGLGIDRVAPALAAAGARSFFVAMAEEGAALRKVIGPDHPIYVFSGFMPGDGDMVTGADLIPLLNSLAQIKRFQSACPGRACGLQFDSGMNRLGLEPIDIPQVLMKSAQLRPELIISHLACGDDPAHPTNATQLAAFATMCAAFPGVRLSLAATAGTMLGGSFHFNMVRPGIGLYGGAPFMQAQPVVSLRAPVIQVRDILPGEMVGYGAGFIARSPCKIATISCGYADGLIRHLSKGMKVFADDVACPSAGRVSMDMITVDVSHLDHIPEQVEILGPHQSIDDLAAAAGTIGHEILTSLGHRYERDYKGA